ncbi:MAG: NADH-quinone oxidoreductase subunit N [Planctomycetes bacterium]|nr:NADH-quinone oxidoreductase subunit N [Planctomycetota bacterium]
MLLLDIDLEQFREVFVPSITKSLHFFGPEFQVAIAAMVILLIDLVLPRKASRQLAWLAVFACLYPALSVLSLYEESQSLFIADHAAVSADGASGMLAMDSYANFFKLFFLLGAVPVILLSYVAKELEDRRMGEYYAILLASILAGMLMASSAHFLMAFISLEFLSICSYILVGFHKNSRASSEAALKYIIYGSVAAGVMGYGLSLLYGLTGTGDLQKFGERLMASIANPEAAGTLNVTAVAATLGLLMTFLGLAYKMAAIPMHFWCPDVYEGAPTPITAFLSVASKAAGFALCLRFFSNLKFADAALDQAISWPVVMIVISMVTMTVGNFAALWQENLKRLFAYSSIAHAGYMMMGVSILGIPGASTGGVQLIAYYLLAYLAMNLGAFAVVILIENRTRSVNLSDYNGMGWRAPFLGVALTVFLFSLIGIPPTAGFTGKFQLFMGVLERAAKIGGHLGTLLYILAVVAVINTAVSVYYYARIIRNLYLTRIEEGGERVSVPFLGTALVAVLVAMTFYLFFSAESILDKTLNLKILGVLP